mmetsp:Transcript_3201/g.5889  ORF Transcript_3201/g.5889 Transcript_3201/m.5889 type:complete len:212 (+) Transcript_3201:173-808(+)
MHKYNNITFLHNIRLSFLSILSCFLHFRHTRRSLVQSLEIIKVSHFRLDESSFKVRMDHSCRLWSKRPLLNRPCSYFLWSCRIKGLQTQCRTSGTNNARNDRLDFGLRSLESHLFRLVCTLLQKCFLLFWVILEVVQILFKFARHWYNLSSSMRLYPFINFRQPLASLSNKVLLRHVDNIHLWFGRNESPILDNFHFGIFKVSRLYWSIGI